MVTSVYTILKLSVARSKKLHSIRFAPAACRSSLLPSLHFMPKMQATQSRVLDWLSSLPAEGCEPREAGHSRDGKELSGVSQRPGPGTDGCREGGFLLKGCLATGPRCARGAVRLVYLAGPIRGAAGRLHRTSRHYRAPLNTNTARIWPEVQSWLTSPTFSRSPLSVSGCSCCAVACGQHFFVVASHLIPLQTPASVIRTGCGCAVELSSRLFDFFFPNWCFFPRKFVCLFAYHLLCATLDSKKRFEALAGANQSNCKTKSNAGTANQGFSILSMTIEEPVCTDFATSTQTRPPGLHGPSSRTNTVVSRCNLCVSPGIAQCLPQQRSAAQFRARSRRYRRPKSGGIRQAGTRPPR